VQESWLLRSEANAPMSASARLAEREPEKFGWICATCYLPPYMFLLRGHVNSKTFEALRDAVKKAFAGLVSTEYTLCVYPSQNKNVANSADASFSP
jgi:hypothetical protein